MAIGYYELTQDSFVGGFLRKAGTIVQYDGTPAGNMRATTAAKFQAQLDPVLADYYFGQMGALTLD